jgi:hypothetical protein
MAFIPGYASKVLANDATVCTTVNSWTATHQRAGSEVTAMCQPLGNAGASYVPGLKSGSLAITGPQDSTGQGLHARIASSIGVDNGLIVTLLPEGDAVGKWAIFAACDPTDWAIDASVTDAVAFSVSATADESIEMGYVLHPLAAETATGNGTAVDRGLGVTSALGLAASLHVTAYTGLTSATVKIQHSTDNSTWADLTTFNATTAIGAQLVKLAAGTTINRYLRSVLTVAGTGSVTFLATVGPR